MSTAANDLTILTGDFAYDGDLCARVHTLDDLRLLDETSVFYQIMDFTPGEEVIMRWANKAYLQHTGQTFEEFQGLTLSKMSVTVKNLQAQCFQKIQVEGQTERMIKAQYPKGKPLKFFWIMRPLRLEIAPSVERTVIFCSTIPVSSDAMQLRKSVAEEWSRYTHVRQMIVDKTSQEVLAGNLAASITYGCTSEMHRGKAPLALTDIFDACEWPSEEAREEAWHSVTALSLRHDPIEMECRMRISPPSTPLHPHSPAPPSSASASSSLQHYEENPQCSQSKGGRDAPYGGRDAPKQAEIHGDARAPASKQSCSTSTTSPR